MMFGVGFLIAVEYVVVAEGTDDFAVRAMVTPVILDMKSQWLAQCRSEGVWDMPRGLQQTWYHDSRYRQHQSGDIG